MIPGKCNPNTPDGRVAMLKHGCSTEQIGQTFIKKNQMVIIEGNVGKHGK